MTGWAATGALALASLSPLGQAGLIVLATFVLEDAATVLAALQAQAGVVSEPLALGALYAGIVLGDLGLYGLGRLSGRVRWAARFVPPSRMRQGRAWLDGRVFPVVFASRFIPGARLPTYTACGFLGANLRAFALATTLATLVWTSLLFGLSLHVGALLLHLLGAWRWAGGVGLVLAILVLGRTAARLQEARR